MLQISSWKDPQPGAELQTALSGILSKFLLMFLALAAPGVSQFCPSLRGHTAHPQLGKVFSKKDPKDEISKDPKGGITDSLPVTEQEQTELWNCSWMGFTV